MKKAIRLLGHKQGQAGTPKAERSTRRRLLRNAAGGIAALSGATLATGLKAKSVRAQGGSGLSGVWQSQLVRDNPPPGLTPFRFLFTFTAEGDVIAAGPPILVESGVRTFITAQLGQWMQIGSGAYRFTFNTTGYSDDGTLAYALNSRMELTLSPGGDSWTGAYGRRDVAPDGTDLRTVTGTATAERAGS